MNSSLSDAKGRTVAAETHTYTRLKGDTVNNKKVRVINGTLVATPFPTSVGPKEGRPDVAGFYGAINRIMNPPNGERQTTYKKDYNNIARTAQSAGTVHKRPVPYHPNAPRNRVFEPTKVADVKGTYRLGADSTIPNRTNYRFRTMNMVDQMAIQEGPLESHVGFTNDETIGMLTRRFREPKFR